MKFNQRKRELSRQQPGALKKSWEKEGFTERVKEAREKQALEKQKADEKQRAYIIEYKASIEKKK